MPITKVILDFDGTITDAFKEGEPFLPEFARLFADRIGASTRDIERVVGELCHRIRDDPREGWPVDGQIVAPAVADPYVLNTTVYPKLVRLLQEGTLDLHFDRARLPGGPAAVEALLFELFRLAYPHSDTCFRPGAKELLDQLVDAYTVAIVTNSSAASVEKKLSRLEDYTGKLTIYGDAKRYVNNPDFEGLPPSIQPEGFPRPILLRREKYKTLLDKLATERDFNPENTAVVGDILELDLAVPLHLGYRGILLVTEGTRPCELSYLRSLPNGFVAHDYEQVKEALAR